MLVTMPSLGSIPHSQVDHPTNACLSSPNRDIALFRLTQEYLMEMLGSGHLRKNHDIGREY